MDLNPTQIPTPRVGGFSRRTTTFGGVTSGSDATQFSPPGSGSDNGGVGDHFQNNWSSNEGVGGTYAWFVAGNPPQSQATQNPVGLFSANSPHTQDGRYYIPIFQATVPAGDCIEGNIGVAMPGLTINGFDNSFSTCVPAPGTLGLLEVWCAVGRRKCRRMR